MNEYLQPTAITSPRALFSGELEWQLAGCTTLCARLDDQGQLTTTLANPYGKPGQLKLFVQQADPAEFTRHLWPQPNPPSPWRPATIVEEIVERDGQYRIAGASSGKHASNDYDEAPWWQTQVCQLPPITSPVNLLLMVLDPQEFSPSGEALELFNSMVISDWVRVP